jgi:hypothetical protein
MSRRIPLFAFSAFISGAILSPTSASATSYPEDFPAFSCAVLSENGGGLYGYTTAGFLGTDYVNVTNYSSTQNVVLICPLPANGSSVSSINAWGYGSGNTSEAQVCNLSASGASASCGTIASFSTGPGNFNLSVNTNGYSDGNFNVLVVTLADSTTSGVTVYESQLYGYQQQISSPF